MSQARPPSRRLPQAWLNHQRGYGDDRRQNMLLSSLLILLTAGAIQSDSVVVSHNVREGASALHNVYIVLGISLTALVASLIRHYYFL